MLEGLDMRVKKRQESSTILKLGAPTRVKLSSAQIRKTVSSSGLGRKISSSGSGTLDLRCLLNILMERSNRQSSIYEFRVQDKCEDANISFRLIGIEIVFIRLDEVTKKKA